MSGIIKNLTNKANTEIIYPITVVEAVILNESTTLSDALDSKVDKALGKQLSQENYTTLEKSKLYSIQSGAQVNPYTFSTIKVSGSGDVVANQQQGSLTFVAGQNIVLGTSPTTKAVTISATGTIAIAASNTSIVDTSEYYTSMEVEGALQEIGYALDHISTAATDIPLEDIGEYYAVDNVEDALQQIGSTLDNLSTAAVDIPLEDIGEYYAVDNVEDALQQIGSTLDNLPVDATDITFTPYGSIISTNVQGAVEELDTNKAPLASPEFTGIPKAPTAPTGTNTTQLATTAYVKAQIADEAVRKSASTGTAVTYVWSGTQAQYDAIGTKNNNTMYFIT